ASAHVRGPCVGGRLEVAYGKVDGGRDRHIGDPVSIESHPMSWRFVAVALVAPHQEAAGRDVAKAHPPVLERESVEQRVPGLANPLVIGSQTKGAVPCNCGELRLSLALQRSPQVGERACVTIGPAVIEQPVVLRDRGTSATRRTFAFGCRVSDEPFCANRSRYAACHGSAAFAEPCAAWA